MLIWKGRNSKKNRSSIKIIWTLFALTGLLSACAANPSTVAETPGDIPRAEREAVVVDIIDKYGFAGIDLTGDDLLAAGYAYGDVLTVKAGEAEFEVPFVTNLSDVDIGQGCLADVGALFFAANMSDFVRTHDIREGMTVSLSLAEKAGYLDAYNLRQMTRSYDRGDYASDEEFANFREVRLGDLAPGTLYRSGSPVDNILERAAYANALAERAGVATVINLTDSRHDLVEYFSSDGFASHFYEDLFDDGRVAYLDLGIDLASDEFRYGLRDGLQFLAEHDGPYLIHCTEGKDRAGFTLALIEALMGAGLDEIVADYMLSFINYYHIEPESEQYAAIAEGNIMRTLRMIVGLDSGADLADVDLRIAAEEYIAALGVAPADIQTIKSNLSSER